MFLIFTLLIATVTLIERKILALTQRRVGPNYIGYKGRLQFIADALKLLAKHITLISKTNRLILICTPALFLLIIYMFWANVVWLPNYAIIEIEYNILLANVISVIFSGLLIVLGYSSNNKFAILSAHRVFVMVCTLELLLGFFGISCALISQALSFYAMTAIGQKVLNFFVLLPMAPVLLLTLLLETGRTPFDLAEAESELIAGYATEFGGFFFAMFYLGEYFHLFSFSAVYVLCIFGAWKSMLTWLYLKINYLNINVLELSFVSITDVVFLALLSSSSYFFFVSNSREKIFYFILFVVSCSVLAFLAGLDAYIFFLLATEFMASLIIFIIFLNSNKVEKNMPTNTYFWIYCSFLLVIYYFGFFNTWSANSGSYHQVYLYTFDTRAHDLAPVFWFFALLSPTVGTITSILLGVFSLFFIAYYFQLKNATISKKEKEVAFKRRQNILKQTRFVNQIGVFWDRQNMRKLVPKR